MPIATSILIAGAALAAGVAGTVQQAQAAKKQAKAAKKRDEKARAIANAPRPGDKTGAEVALASKDTARRRGKGSLAQRQRAAALSAQSASAVGGL